MNRRELLKLSAGSVASLAGVSGCQTAATGGISKKISLHKGKHRSTDQSCIRSNKINSLAGRSLGELRAQYRYDLFDDFLPFMDKHIIDHELGGFMCNADRDGTKINTNKNSWYMGRGIWVYSFLYNELAAEKKYLEVSRKTTRFVLRDRPKGDDLWTAEYTKDGAPIKPQGQYIGGKYIPVSKEVYGDLFIANGLAEYARASGEDKYWHLAKKILFKCIRIFDRPDYAPTAAQVYLGPDAPEIPGVRPMGVWMLLVRLASQMLNQQQDPQIKAVADRCLEAIFNCHYNPEYDLLNEVLLHDMSRPENVYRNLVYTGHGIETMWMVLYEAHRRRDKNLFDKASRFLPRHLEVAWDDVYGGFFRGLKNVDENTWILDKALWVQEEALIGTLFVVEHTGAQWAKEWFSRIYNFVQDKYPLKKHGYSLWDFWPDRKVTFVKHYQRIGNFHHPRHLMLNLLSLQRMIERGGRVSSDFS